MVIELSGVQFGLKSYAWFQNKRARSASLIWNHKYDFRPKLHDTKFHYNFITSILKSPNLFAERRNRYRKHFSISFCMPIGRHVPKS